MRQVCCGVRKISTIPNNRLSARWLRLTTMTRILYALPFIFKFGYPSEVYKRKALINWAAGTGPDYEMPSIFSREGGGGYSWEFVVGLCLPALQILTLFQTNTYKAYVREYPRNFLRQKINTINRSFSLSRNKHGTKNKFETVQWKKPRKWNVTKDWYINNLSKSQVFVAHSFWVICRNISRTIIDAIFVYSFGTQIWPPKINKNIWSSLFLKKALSFHSSASIRVYKHIF